MTLPVAPAFTAWLDSFFAAYYRRRPVSATFIGIHTFDEQLPDLSEAGISAGCAEAEALLERLDGLPPESLSTWETLDHQLAEGFLRVQRWECSSRHFGPTNPVQFTGEAIFGLISLLLHPSEARVESARKRLESVPDLLHTGMLQIECAPEAWLQRARRECAGAGVLMEDAAIAFPPLRGAAARAAAAFAEFDRFLGTNVTPTQEYACGAEALELVLRQAHMVNGGASGVEQMALERMAIEEEALRAGALPAPVVVEARRPRRPRGTEAFTTPGSATTARVPTTTRGAAQTPGVLATEGAPGADYLAQFDALWHTVRHLTHEHDVLTFPDWPVRFVDRPAWARRAAPSLYFLPYRSPAPFDAPRVVEYLAPPGADDSTIKLNHVVHHASLGHQVQNWFAARSQSRIGQIAAVDCASRIAMLCGGTMAEGWANYATDLVDERYPGFLTPTERYGQHHARLRMAARAVVDIRLHQGRITLEEAVNFYSTRVGMPVAAARAEAVKNSLFPGAACMYLIGWDTIRRLRRELESRSSTPLNLREFHDRLLSFGSVPVSLIARAMLESAAVPVLSQQNFAG
jgi:hypothetical protein